VPYEDVTYEQRRNAKALNFGIIYGMGWKKFVAYSKWTFGVTFDEEQAKAMIQGFRDTYSSYYKWQIAQGKLCEQMCFTDTVIGHGRALDEGFTYTAGINHPIQGSAGHVLLRALIRLEKAFKAVPQAQARLCLTVHDEISCYCPRQYAEAVKGTVESQMVAGFLDIFPQGSTKDLVDAKIGPDWSEVK
jgi:DNA polymerase-1